MRKIFLATIAILLSASLMGQNIKLEKPTSKNRNDNTFAIVIDNTTFNKVQKQVYDYRDALQEDNLATYILRGDWETPHQLRSELEKLYKKAKNLEGIVLIGDIPVAMVRNAQHMTTAFKMDEDKFDRNESSVGSDRFYDDLHLKFEYIGRDSVDTDFFYYNLTTDSPQRLNPTYYSARIKYPEELGGDKYQAIGEFLEKVVAAKKNPQNLDNLVTFAGHGYNSDCLITWMDESVMLEENFPFIENSSRNLKQLNFRHEDYMKYRLFDELQRPEVDAILFNEHGSIDKQHISEFPSREQFGDYVDRYKKNYGWSPGPYDILRNEINRRQKAGLSQSEIDKYEKALIDTLKRDFHVTDLFFEDYFKSKNMTAEQKKEAALQRKRESEEIIITLDELKGVAPQPYFVVFNACYNGSFHRKGNISGYYIFGKGRTVAAQGNTVNVLQDKWTYEAVGIISLGARVGEYNRLVATLEGHLIGDPTFHYNNGGDIPTFRGEIVRYKNDAAYWRKQLENKYAPVQVVALRMLADLNALSSAELLQKMRESKFGTVRMECLKLLSLNLKSAADNDAFIEGIKLALRDNYEQVRRAAASLAGRSGDPRLSYAVVSEYLNYPEQKRVNYNLSGDFQTMNFAALREAVEQAKGSMTYLDNDAILAKVKKSIDNSERRTNATVKEIMGKDEKLKDRVSSIRTTRNYNMHEYIPHFLYLLQDSSNPLEVRLNMAEALGWYVYSYRKSEIVDGINSILANQANTLEPQLKAELNQTLLRLQ